MIFSPANTVKQLLSQLSIPIETLITRGLEKEGLRITPSGYLSQKPHPIALGSKLTHPYITTDYSESLLEFITPPTTSISSLLNFLTNIHAYTYQHLGDEIIWPASMPCILTKEEDIPIADYGNSNIGLMKSIYRRGLAYRYGKNMQTIAGVHFNFSYDHNFWESVYRYYERSAPPIDLQQFINQQSMRMIRNYLRYSWLIIYLFGASPSACRSFDKDNKLGLQAFGTKSLYGPYATSLRMSDAGYHNNAQADLEVSYNSLEEYIRDLKAATAKPDPRFAKFGVKVDGEYRQLSDHTLQIEAEYYAQIRPKRVVEDNERQLSALKKRGIQYYEVRSLDLDPFEPAGINEHTIKFLDCFMLFCLFSEDRPIGANDRKIIHENQRKIVTQGRQENLLLTDFSGQAILFQDWAKEIVEQCLTIGSHIEELNKDDVGYLRSIAFQLEKVNNPEELPSAKLSELMIKNFNSCFYDCIVSLAQQHKVHYLSLENLESFNAEQEKIAKESIKEQREIETHETSALDETIKAYLTQ